SIDGVVVVAVVAASPQTYYIWCLSIVSPLPLADPAIIQLASIYRFTVLLLEAMAQGALKDGLPLESPNDRGTHILVDVTKRLGTGVVLLRTRSFYVMSQESPNEDPELAEAIRLSLIDSEAEQTKRDAEDAGLQETLRLSMGNEAGPRRETEPLAQPDVEERYPTAEEYA
ncbi:hypothetical protein FOZ63_012145, partial [Perkinsus olseni]